MSDMRAARCDYTAGSKTLREQTYAEQKRRAIARRFILLLSFRLHREAPHIPRNNRDMYPGAGG